jgi:hypothetical protein
LGSGTAKTKTSNKVDKSNRATTAKRVPRANKKTGTAYPSMRAPRGRTAKAARSARKGSKQQACLDLLCRAEGENTGKFADFGVHLSCDTMASFLTSYGSPEAMKVTQDLDFKVEALLTAAAS